MASMFRALRNRNYRLFFFGQGLSLIGTWMQRVALGWLVYRMTDSALLLGVIAFVAQLPVSLLSPVAGAFADRLDRRKLLIWTQVLEALQATVLAALTLSGLIEVWHIVVLSLFLGSLFAFESPTRQAFVIEMTGPEDLMNGIALNSSAFNVARLVGPALAGFIVAASGEGIIFVCNAVSYVAVMFGLLAMRMPERTAKKDRESVITRIREGVNYAFGAGPIRFLLLMLALITLAGTWHAVLMPIFARDILKGGAETLGLLMAANGAGALTGAIMLAKRKNTLGLAKILTIATAVFAASLIGLSLSTNLYLSIAMMFIIGISYMHEVAGTNTLVQTLVPDEMRGRVMSLFILSFLGIMPFGNLIAGWLASIIGAAHTVTISGAAVAVACILFVTKMSRLSHEIRCVQMSRGFIEEGAEDIPDPKECHLG